MIDLKDFIKRLENGESLESVRKDFMKKFDNVPAEKIVDAEQQLIDSGISVNTAKKLCDVHSVLFHDKDKKFTADFDFLDAGHPAQILHSENVALGNFLDELTESVTQNDAETFTKKFPRLNAIYSHYGKKEMLFMPTLYNHGVTGPSQVMWAVDDDIKRAMRGLMKSVTIENFDSLKEKITALIQNIREMIFKEENIFIPLSLKFFTQDDWTAIYRDSAEIGYAFINDAPKWEIGEKFINESAREIKNSEDGKINFDTGELTFAQLKGILKLLPVDITFIDADDNVKFFVNEGGIFARPKLAIGNKIFNCHPPEVLPMIHKLLADFKAKKRDCMEIFRPIKGKPVGVTYRAVYDENGEYIGAVEFVQDFSAALKKFKTAP